jgi:hypothetical protein
MTSPERELRERLEQFGERLRKFSCPSANVSDEFVNGWDAATDHCAERIDSILRNATAPASTSEHMIINKDHFPALCHTCAAPAPEVPEPWTTAHKRVWLSCEGCSMQVKSDFKGRPPTGWSEFGLSRFRGHGKNPGFWCPQCIAERRHI